MGEVGMLGAGIDVWRAGREGRDGVERRQRERLAGLVAYGRARSPFYAERYAGLPQRVEDVRMLPPTTKPELMARLDDWVTDRAVTRSGLEAFVADPALIGREFLGRYVVCTTSGSTGSPAILVQDRSTLAVIGALNIVRGAGAWMTPGILVGLFRARLRTAGIWATHGHFLGITLAMRQIFERPSRARSIRPISVLTPLPQMVDELNAFQPGMLNGYATAIALLADEQQAGRLRIHPELVITASESLPVGERERIARAFGATVRDQYGCSEFLSLGFDCGRGWLHVNADWAILEAVDEDGHAVPPGQSSSKTYLTNLVNRVQPILRYELGDRITVNPDPCPCGRTLPAIRVEGRTDDVLRFSVSGREAVPVLPLALWSVAKGAPGVHRFQLIQTGDARLSVRLELDNGADAEAAWRAVRERLSAYLGRQGLAAVQVDLVPEAPERDPQSGKFRQVWRSRELAAG